MSARRAALLRRGLDVDAPSKPSSDPGQPAVPGFEPAKHVVVTRAEPDNGPLSSQLRELGLQVLLWPAVNVAAAQSAPLEEALRSLDKFDWIVFASRHAVAAVTQIVTTPPANLRVAAVGQAT